MKEDKSKCVFCKNVDMESKRKNPRWIADLQVSTAFQGDNSPQHTMKYAKLHFKKSK